MKILTICIPCNKQTKTIIETISSCLIKEESIEILIVNHHANDFVIEECNQYITKYPDTIRMITSNDSIMQEARGLYFKILPAKDTVDQSALVKVLETLESLLRIQANLDMLVCDFEYKTNKKKKERIDYHLALPTDQVFEWHQIKYFATFQCFTMESVVFKTNILKTLHASCYLDTLYNSFMFPLLPIIKVKAMLYLDVSMHIVDAKIPELTYLNTVDECIANTKEMIDGIDIQDLKSRKMKHYVCRHINILLVRCVVSLLKRGQIEDRVKKEELWDYLQIHNYALYKHCKNTIVGRLISKDHRIIKAMLIKANKWMF